MPAHSPSPITRRTFLKSAAAGAAAAAWPGPLLAAGGASGKRPDILFIAVEDTSPHRFGCWGNPICKTPAIDGLAARGLRFDNAHAMTAVCNPSRTALLTCLRPDTTKVYGNTHDWRTMVPQAQSMPEQLKRHGYETVRIGKIFHHSFEHDASWTRVIKEWDSMPKPPPARKALGPDAGYSAGKVRQLLKQGKREEADAYKEQFQGAFGSPFSWGPTGRDDLEEPDGMLATHAVRVLGTPREKPLFLALGFHAPHLSWRAPDKYFAMYPPEKMELPKIDPNARPSRDHRLLTEATWREAIAAQYACITFIDAQIARVLEALEKAGRANNTLIVFWSDHGFMLGEHYQWRKGQLHDESTRVALIMNAPGVIRPGSVCKRPVESIDIFPTLLDLAGVPIPSGIEAVSMRPLLLDPARPWKRGAITSHGSRRSIVTERFRYNEEKNGRTALFDHERDPVEINNLAKDPKYAETLAELGRLLNGPWQDLLPDDLRPSNR